MQKSELGSAHAQGQSTGEQVRSVCIGGPVCPLLMAGGPLWAAQPKTPKGEAPEPEKRGKLCCFALWLRSLACVLCAGAEVLAITNGEVSKRAKSEIQCFKVQRVWALCEQVPKICGLTI